MFNFYKKSLGSTAGFTLIELLVVISIIGMLASIILAAVGTSRDRAKNAKIQSSIIQLRNAIELKRSSDGTYPVISTTPANVCGNSTAFLDPDITPIVTDLTSVLGKGLAFGSGPISVASFGFVVYTDAFNTASCTTYPITANTNTASYSGGPVTRYAIIAALGPTIGSNGYACIDSQGGALSSSTHSFVNFRSPEFMKGGLCQ